MLRAKAIKNTNGLVHFFNGYIIVIRTKVTGLLEFLIQEEINLKASRKKWKMMNIQTRLKKGFRFTTILTALAGGLAIIVLGIMSTQYSDALKYYGFSQGDIGKAMVAFTETRSCTRGLIGYKDLV